MNRAAARTGTAAVSAWARLGLAASLAAGLCCAPQPAGADTAAETAAAPRARPQAAEVTVRRSDLVFLTPGVWSAPDIAAVPVPPTRPPATPGPRTPELKRIGELITAGRAQGFGGLIYENRDRGHSRLSSLTYSDMTVLRYDAALQQRGLDYGLGGRVLVPGIVIGNASVATSWGSMARLAMIRPDWPGIVFRTYVQNQLYIYPEHRDHDAADLYPANWPYTLSSQGSSGSDKAFLRALAMTLAAFTPQTRAALERQGLVAPTLQMLLRRNLAPVQSRADYLSGAAHPAAFDGRDLRPVAMIEQAVSMTPETIPPMVRLRVESESFADVAGLGQRSERLFTTPSAIARIWRGPAFRRDMVVSAADTADPNGRALRFDWVLLRGDPSRVRIEPLDPAGTRARIGIDWHDPFETPIPHEEGTRRNSRVDIGVFAWNGAQDSAPAFLTVSFPHHQIRRYASGPDGVPRLAAVDYDATARDVAYDRVLHWSAPWTDSFEYGADGALSGWVRRPRRGPVSRFGPAGAPEGRDLPLRYEVVEDGRRRPILTPILRLTP